MNVGQSPSCRKCTAPQRDECNRALQAHEIYQEHAIFEVLTGARVQLGAEDNLALSHTFCVG